MVAVFATVVAIWWRGILPRDVAQYLFARSPHDRYAALLRINGQAGTSAGVAWFSAAASAAVEAEVVPVPHAATGAFDAEAPIAVAWKVAARRGHRLEVDVDFQGEAPFVDVFDSLGGLVASAPRGDDRLVHDLAADGELVIRVQPAIGIGGAYSLQQHLNASLGFPVDGLTPRAVKSMFGASRDEGRRRHEGIDIFAPRGTAVLAAADGWVGNSLTNNLGGNVVWVWSPSRRLSTYYAHLDRHAVVLGDSVQAGEVVGYVGTSGNAKDGAPHLHFGVYLAGQGSVDPLPYVCAAPCGR